MVFQGFLSIDQKANEEEIIEGLMISPHAMHGADPGPMHRFTYLQPTISKLAKTPAGRGYRYTGPRQLVGNAAKLALEKNGKRAQLEKEH